jgi:methionine sulfoxide reductase heme-binding subunit
MTPAAPANYVWWLAGRSAGFVAMALITFSVILGLAMAARIIPPGWRRDAMRLHQHLALIALGAIAAHGLLLAADPWLKAGLKGIVVPFAIGYRPLWTGLGIVGGYLAAILALSFYVRGRIGARVWRRMHRFTVVVYVLALAHSLGSGTDASIPLVRYAMLASTLPVLFLFALRLQRTRGRTGASRPQARAAPEPEVGAAARARVLSAAPSSLPAAGRQASACALAPHLGQRELHPSRAY